MFMKLRGGHVDLQVGILSIYFRLVELPEILRFPESNTAEYLSSSLVWLPNILFTYIHYKYMYAYF